MKRLAILAVLFLIGITSGSTFEYTSSGTNYIATLSGAGVINPSLAFHITGGYIVPYNPQDTYTVTDETMPFNTQAWESPGGGGIDVMYDTDPVILVGNTSVFKMWYQAGISPQAMGYAESTDGVTWTKYNGNPVIGSGYFGGTVVKDSGTYYMFCSLATDTNHVTRFSSANGVTWANDGEIASKAGGWSSSGIMYQDVWEGSEGNWHMLVSGVNATNRWSVGLWDASSPGGSWTYNTSSPVIQAPGSGSGSGLVYLPSGTYEDSNGYTWTWVSNADNPSGGAMYTDSMRYRTANPYDLRTWEPNPVTYLNVGPVRYTGYGFDWQGRSPQQYLRVGNTTYEFYTYNTAGHPGYEGLLTTPLRIDHIIATDEMYPNLTYQQV